MMKTTRHISLLLALFVTLPGISANATPVTIAEFTFTDNSAASSDTETSTTTSNITKGAGIKTGDTFGEIFTNNYMIVRGHQTTAKNTTNTLADQQPLAIAADDYVTFTVTIPKGIEVSLSGMIYKWANQNPYRQSYGIYSDKTGFSYANILDGQHASGATGTGGSMSAFTSRTIDLSAKSQLQDLTDTTVEFRFYITHPQSSSSLRASAFDDIVLEGTAQNTVYPGTVLIIK